MTYQKSQIALRLLFGVFALFSVVSSAKAQVTYPYEEYKPNQRPRQRDADDESVSRFQSFEKRGYTTVYYQVGVPSGQTQDFINTTSFRGVGIELGAYVTPQFSLGISANWNVFYKPMGVQTTNIDSNTTVTGEQYRYINAFPLLVKGHYYFRNENSKVWPYVGIGVGAIYSKNEMDIGALTLTNNGWQFALAPEAGIQARLKENLNFVANLRYTYGAENSNMGVYNAVNLNLGLSFTY